MIEIGTVVKNPTRLYAGFSRRADVIVAGYVYYEEALYYVCIDRNTGKQEEVHHDDM